MSDRLHSSVSVGRLELAGEVGLSKQLTGHLNAYHFIGCVPMYDVLGKPSQSSDAIGLALDSNANRPRVSCQTRWGVLESLLGRSQFHDNRLHASSSCQTAIMTAIVKRRQQGVATWLSPNLSLPNSCACQLGQCPAPEASDFTLPSPGVLQRSFTSFLSAFQD